MSDAEQQLIKLFTNKPNNLYINLANHICTTCLFGNHFSVRFIHPAVRQENSIQKNALNKLDSKNTLDARRF